MRNVNRNANRNQSATDAANSKNNVVRLMETEGDKKQALKAALSQIERSYGKGSVMRLGDDQQIEPLEAVSTGSLGLDLALGIGGLPRGRVVEIYGPESSGKTTLALHVVAEAQKEGGTCGFVDAEHALDPTYAEKLGVKVADLLISQPDNGEQALEIADTLVRSGAVDVLVVDSVAALTPRAELEGDMGDSLPGLHARLMSQALRKLTASIARSNTMVIFINQIRMKIGIMFGNPETTTGGNALKFYSSVRLDIRRIGALKQGDEVIGNQTRVKIVKNKVAPPFRMVEFDILYGEGISKLGELIDLGVKHELLEKSGSWYSWRGERIGQGKENVRQFLREHDEVAAAIEAALRGTTPAEETMSAAEPLAAAGGGAPAVGAPAGGTPAVSAPAGGTPAVSAPAESPAAGGASENPAADAADADAGGAAESAADSSAESAADTPAAKPSTTT